MKHASSIVAATFALLVAALPASPQSAAQADVVLPEVSVNATSVAQPHPQDGNFSEAPLGCAEIVTPRGTGNELGGYHQARFARAGIPVIPSLRDPSSAHDTRPDITGKDHQATPAGQEGKRGC